MTLHWNLTFVEHRNIGKAHLLNCNISVIFYYCYYLLVSFVFKQKQQHTEIIFGVLFFFHCHNHDPCQTSLLLPSYS